MFENFEIIAGPCSVESEEQVMLIADAVKKLGATMLRGGAFKPRTSPYSFQGLKDYGIELLLKAKAVTGLPIVSEITDISQIEKFDGVDVLQVGSRNMHNYELLKKLGSTNKTILLKRGFGSTVEELLFSAEYITSQGNKNVILCERGIRTFNTYTRNTLDICAVPFLKKNSSFPVIVDPSHGTGRWDFVIPMAMASVAAGADGIMVEVHNSPKDAIVDGEQSLSIENFEELVNKIKPLLPFSYKKEGKHEGIVD